MKNKKQHSGFFKAIIASLVAAFIFAFFTWLYNNLPDNYIEIFFDTLKRNIKIPVWLLTVILFLVLIILLILKRSKIKIPLSTFKLSVITDPRFIESAVFHWIFRQQPFLNEGVLCKIIATDWRSIPEKISSNINSIGLYNRRAVLTYNNNPLYNIQIWSDLTLYKGYALLIRPTKEISSPVTLKSAENYMKKKLEERNLSSKKPLIICMGGDTVWKMQTPLTPYFDLNDYTIESFDSPDEALKIFLSGQGDYFLGGLPQRLSARSKGCIEVLNYDNNPLLFSINSLICNEEVYKNKKELLSNCESIWYQTVHQLKHDKTFRKKVSKECLDILNDFEFSEHNLNHDYFDLLFNEKENVYELFPEHPAGILERITFDLIETLSNLDLKRITKPQMMSIMNHYGDIIKVNIEKEKYPSM